jgi:Mrp family chromosome partitioning ATPase
MRGLWDQLERGDAVVLVDLPPVLVGDDVIQIASHVHGLLLVVEERGTELEDLNEARDLLAEFNVLGAVLNKSSEDRGGYAGYYYGAAQPVDQPGSR